MWVSFIEYSIRRSRDAVAKSTGIAKNSGRHPSRVGT